MEPITIALALAKATGLSDFIGRKLAGERGADIAAKVMDAASIVTGQTDPKEVLSAMREDTAKIQELKLRILEISEADSQREVADRADARAMQIAALNQEDKVSKQFVYWFAWAWSFIAAAYIFAITFIPIPEASVRFADTVLGFLLGTIIASILNYFYGSSKSSNNKDATIATLGNVMKDW